MKRERIEHLMEQATSEWSPGDLSLNSVRSHVRYAIETAVREERERCAKVCDEKFSDHYDHSGQKIGARYCAQAIRALEDE